MAFVGYARVSTARQDLSLQLDALSAANCGKIFTDEASGGKADRKGLVAALAYVRAGDVLVIWKLDRLARSMSDLIATVADLDRRGVGLHSITEKIDTTTATGKLVFHVFAALAEFERGLILERTTAGLQAARERGRTGGRKPVVTGAKLAKARDLIEGDRKLTVAQAALVLKVSRSALYAALKRA